MAMIRIFLFILIVFVPDANAWNRHGTTFDASWTTINCVGTSADDTAWAAWKTASVAANPVVAKLHVTGNCLLSTATRITEGIRNVIIYAEGASLNQAYVGGVAYCQDAQHSARIQTVSAGARQVTLVTPAEASRFSIGDWITVDGLQLQLAPSYPPNWQFFEFHTITNISGAVITLDGALKNSYKSTWPLIDAGSGTSTCDSGTIDLAGPASIHKMQSSWDTDVLIYGLTVTGGGSVGTVGRNIHIYDLHLSSGIVFAPSVSQTIVIQDGHFDFAEIDKEIDFIKFSLNFGQIEFQSASVNTVLMENSALAGGGALSLLGTPQNLTLTGNNIPTIRGGPTAYGHGNTIIASNNTITTAEISTIMIDITAFSFGSGTFTIARADANWADAIRWGVPGKTYYFGNGSGLNNSSPHAQFTITDITDDGVNTSFVTDIVGPLPTPNCGVPACTKLVAYQAQTVSQTSSGPADITVFAP